LSTPPEEPSGTQSLLTERLPWLILLLAIVWYCLSAVSILPIAGIQQDEAIFLGPLNPPYWTLSEIGIPLAEARMPAMLMPYLGCLKTWIYIPLLEIFPRNEWTLRLPMVSVGCITILLTFLLVRQIAGAFAAAFASLLLATDTAFIFLTTYDWGPVSIQLCLQLAVALLVIRYVRENSPASLYLAPFFAGLLLWNQALFLWTAGAFGLAALLFYWRPIFARLRPLHVVLAIDCFLLGALPFVYYNIQNNFATFQNSYSFSWPMIWNKLTMAKWTLEGHGFEHLFYGQGTVEAAALDTTTISTKIAGYLGGITRGFQVWLLFFSLIGFPFMRDRNERKTVGLLLAGSAIATIQMLITDGAGTGWHHHGLLIPAPLLVIVFSVFSLTQRWVSRYRRSSVALVAALILLGNQASFHTLRAYGQTHGTSVIWTDAVESLHQHLIDQGYEQVGVLDWGIFHPLSYYAGHSSRYIDLSAQLASEPVTDSGRQTILELLRTPNSAVVLHAEGKAIFPDFIERFRILCNAEGLVLEAEEQVPDGKGRLVFSVETVNRSNVQ
jgi:4-amino-4-deoxy-L-arabinose transferase-like glycosyltransferase